MFSIKIIVSLILELMDIFNLFNLYYLNINCLRLGPKE
jgi:hypothetical protein